MIFSILDPSCSEAWVRLDGGLGNQMFQYAFGRALAHRQRRDLVLDAAALAQARPGITPRSYALDVFHVRARINKTGACISDRSLWLLRRLPWLARLRGVHSEVGHDHDATALSDVRSCYWAGYWQSPLYFESIGDALFDDFQPVRPLSASAQTFIAGLDPARTVMLHVRRGDYVSLPSAANHHGAAGLDYYRMAVERCLQAVPRARVVVFSDDIAWCREAGVAAPAKDVTYVEPDKFRTDWEDLWMMSHCGHHIIANSSFSWWSAWLADRRFGRASRHVFAPRRWFQMAEVCSTDRFPAHWGVL